MISALAPAILLLIATAEPTAGDSQASAKLQMSQAEFSRGDFEGALRTLDSAASQASDEKLLAKIHLLRGQCFAAAQNFVAADASFAKALENDPEASLDAAKVDPTVVGMVESLRTQLRGELRIQTDPRGATVSIDGRPAGISPLTVPVSIGRHVVEAKSPDGKLSWREEVLVRVKKTTLSKLMLREGGKEGRRWSEQSKPIADLRLLLQPTAGDFFGIEIGGGFEYQFLRLSLHASLYPNFGLIPRVALAAPVANRADIYLSFEIPTIFASPTLFGLGGSGGGEYKVSQGLGLFMEIVLRHFLTCGRTCTPRSHPSPLAL